MIHQKFFLSRILCYKMFQMQWCTLRVSKLRSEKTAIKTLFEQHPLLCPDKPRGSIRCLTDVEVNIRFIQLSLAKTLYMGNTCRDGFRGGGKGPVPPPSNFFYLYVTATINSKKISFNDVQSLLNLKNYIHNYILVLASRITQQHTPLAMFLKPTIRTMIMSSHI